MNNSVKDSTYDFIGKLAIALYSQGITITVDALRQILNDEGEKYSFDSNQGIGQSVSAAYRAWEKVDPVIHHAIAYTFVGRHGNLVWDK